MLKTVTNSINASQIQTPITLPGDVTLSTGNLVIGTSGKGIDFSATPGTGTSELLSDYEEGTWTPAFAALSGGFAGITYTTQDGKYTRVGNTVTATFNIAVDTVTTGTAAVLLVMTGLPFAMSGATCLTTYQSNFATQGPDYGQYYASSTNILFRSKTATGFANVLPSEIQAGTELQGIVTYFV